ncbi:probable methyltransferase-like protein 25 isoform X2 [Paramacrobiotus metropolitanus]|uniref:probable methyltransferase-like protein 25 isoform X2 n=1 Tax=Paramacrobiotus metropolitanus TaxID=2943436 RepID=UPI0024462A4F|nr:probable methyltransferase-like protein 25 isoform X2 [Paramacrobiotus metropolitanus]XP_055334562.1 probable methyltransferase-like protein 25 isoform X2 [Paramacrobiotus metropolitanus]XP_055334564.1 probable methyltransferase-like protein 25 isoform X2 [Paramacrobiotus metropolitanus]
MENLVKAVGVTGIKKDSNSYFSKAIDYIATWKWLHNFKLTRFYVDGIYKQLPETWYQSLNALTDEHLLLLLQCIEKRSRLRTTFSMLPESLLDFLEDTNRLTMARNLSDAVAELPSDLQTCLGFSYEERGESFMLQECQIPRNLTYGMSPKKYHEVSRMAVIVSQICRQQDIQYVVDLGAGMGYLDCVMCDVYGLNVIAVECDYIRTESATKRAIKHTRKRPMRGRLFHHTLKIESNEQCAADLQAILEQSGADRFCLVGLHCCGDFTPVFLDLFAKLPLARAMVCVGCCYHLMQYDQSGSHVQRCPLSSSARTIWNDVLKSNSMLVSVASLRLATQETRVRWLNELDAHAHCHSFRALLEAAAEKGGFLIRKKRRHASTDEYGIDFDAFVRSVFKNYQIEGCTDESGFVGLLSECYTTFHEPYYRTLRIFRVLQGLIQGVLETFITIDRLLYIREDCDIDTCCVIPVFDEAQSPRNLSLVSVK